MLLLIALVAIVSASPAEPILVPPSAPVEEGDVASFALRPGPAGTVFVDGCAAIELERREAAGWVLAPGAVKCDGSLVARMSTKDLVFSVAPPGPGEYRGVVAWGTGCVEGRPLALAACKAHGIARTAAFTVVARPPAVQR
ncbi:MAG: hypothetical protein Q8P41_04375 [Pseudomonadota bacterium]|nr:hypothetical protein [Pseudomonadota bacterium]